MTDPATIFIVDDDDSVRKALSRVMTAAGWKCEAFASADDFLAHATHPAAGCLVADITMQGMTGLELKRALDRAGWDLPLIFVTAHDEESVRTAAREAGAAGCFCKPVDRQALLDAIHWSLGQRLSSPATAPAAPSFPSSQQT